MVPITAKRIVLAAVGLAIAILAILAPCFTIIKMDLGALGSEASLGALMDLTKENGFMLLGGQSMYVTELNMLSEAVAEAALEGAVAGVMMEYVVYDWLNIFMQVFNIVLLVAAVAAAVLAVLWFCLWKKSSGMNAVAVAGIAVGVLYMAAGLTFFFVVKNAYFDLIQQSQDVAIPSAVFKTSCFVPLIILAVLEAAYWICKSVIKERDSAQQSEAAMAAEAPQAAAGRARSMAVTAPAPQKTPVFDFDEKKYAETLARLKELYDAGVLTPEEYEEQKLLSLYSGTAAALARQWQMYQAGMISAEEYQKLKKRILKLE